MAEQRTLYPILVLPEKYARTVGRDALRSNIMAAVIIGEILKTSLGPRGMDKMLVDELGDIIVTNDGYTILDEMQVEHPAAKLIIEIAKTQDTEVGDGTKRSVVLAGELLRKAEDLLDNNIHSTVIIEGYKRAMQFVEKTVSEIAKDVSIDDAEALKKIAKSALSSKIAGMYADKIADLVVNAVKKVTAQQDDRVIVDLDAIKIEKRVGGGIEDTELIDGIVIDKERVHQGMPKIVKEAKIALINDALEVKETETDARINITSPEQP